MEWIGRLLVFLDADMKVPQMYDWFHLTFFAASILTGVLLCRLHVKNEARFLQRLLLVSAFLPLILEIYKQVNYTFTYSNSKIIADYQWYSFPFQFCSTPIYVSLLACIVHKDKVRSSLCAYLATFALFAGLCVMVYPAQVFIDTIGINIQTMVCHGTMITVGICLLGRGYVKLENKTILRAIPVFAACVVLAAIMNDIAYLSGLLKYETFNMFFISPHCPPSLPVYSLVQAVVPFPWCMFIYIAAFSLAAYLVLLLAKLIRKIHTASVRVPNSVK